MSGFKALVLTADLAVTGKRRCNARKPFLLPPHLTSPMFTIVRLYIIIFSECSVQKFKNELLPPDYYINSRITLRLVFLAKVTYPKILTGV